MLFDEQGNLINPEEWEAVRLGRESVERQKFFDVYAPEIMKHDGRYWRFPYTEVSPSLLEYDRSRFVNISTAMATKAVSESIWPQFTESYERVPEHFARVLESISDGTFIDDEGQKPIAVDEQGNIDVTPIAQALAREGYTRIEVFGSIYPEGKRVIEESDKFYLLKGVFLGDKPLEDEDGYTLMFDVTAPDERNQGIDTTFHVMAPYTEYGVFLHFGFMYLTLYALVSLLNCGRSVRAIAFPQKKDRVKNNVTTDIVKMPNDAVHKALLDRPESTTIEASQYFEPDAKGIEIPTGGGGHATVTIINDMPFDSAMAAYRLGPVDRFWYEAVCSLAYDGMGVIRGSQLLMFNGYKNPRQKSARGTMEQALSSIAKMSRVRVGIDTTAEKKKRYKNLSESYGFRPVIDCNYDIMRFDDGTLDFEITLNTTNDGTPFGALPLAVYSQDKKQLLSASREEMEFGRTEGLTRLETDQRMMWRYVMRRIREKKTSETIVFDTIFKNLEQPELMHPAENRHKRARMLTTLYKMLEVRQKQGILKFQWNRNQHGQKEYSVTIKLAKEASA